MNTKYMLKAIKLAKKGIGKNLFPQQQPNSPSNLQSNQPEPRFGEYRQKPPMETTPEDIAKSSKTKIVKTI